MIPRERCVTGSSDGGYRRRVDGLRQTRGGAHPLDARTRKPPGTLLASSPPLGALVWKRLALQVRRANIERARTERIDSQDTNDTARRSPRRSPRRSLQNVERPPVLR